MSVKQVIQMRRWARGE